VPRRGQVQDRSYSRGHIWVADDSHVINRVPRSSMVRSFSLMSFFICLYTLPVRFCLVSVTCLLQVRWSLEGKQLKALPNSRKMNGG
jgi:hypothetical protein